MTRFSTRCSLLLALSLGGLGCGSSQAPPASSAPPTSSGQERASTPAVEPEPAAVAEARPPVEAVGPAAITVEASVHGKPAPASVRVLSADGSEVASGKAGDRLTLQSGEYSMHVQITDAAAMLDKPTQERPLTLHAGDDLHEPVEFRWAMVQLNVVINGHSESNATVQLFRQGEPVGTIKSGAAPVPISPGRYEAQVKTRGAQVDVKGLMFPEGATQTVPVNVQM